MPRYGPGKRVVAVAALAAAGFVAAGFVAAGAARAGAQIEERLAPSVVAGLSAAIADSPVPEDYAKKPETRAFIDGVSGRLVAKIPDYRTREDFLATLHYEATRAGLDPQLMLGLVYHESNFRKYAISTAGARGYTQVMPFWTRLIGNAEQNLFNLRTNLRYGCVILRHYLDIEGGDLYRALGRYNGSLGKPEYPNAVMAAALRWKPAPDLTSQVGIAAPVLTR